MAESTKNLVPRFFNKTTLCYDKIINRTTFRKDKYWKKEILKKIPQSESILDLACGTGILTRQISKKFPKAKIFLATDYVPSLELVVTNFGKKVMFQDIKRSRHYDKPLQYGCRPKKKNKPAGPKQAEESILDCILLSKCNFMIRGYSNLPSISSYWNTNVGLQFVCKYSDEDKKYLGISE
ncbi:hypothetical protein LCGC14_1715490 [marine sediment metagenome]|uniref:Methyltransferase domain-containing protein n=1 Tax=marine sediment metagenome TaxID=412755 RepID=A0A0F9HDQ5_9ZZZZ